MSLPDPKDIPFSTLTTLFRICAQPNWTGALRYRLPRETLMLDGESGLSKSYAMVEREEEGILWPADICRLMAPYVVKVCEYRDETEAALRRAKTAERRADIMEEELKHLRAIVYPENPFNDKY
jgi:hypothetical protein